MSHRNIAEPLSGERVQYANDPITDSPDGEFAVEVPILAASKGATIAAHCGVCSREIVNLTAETKKEDLLAWIRPCRHAFYHLGCIIARLPLPAGVTDPYRVCEYRRCPEKYCCNKADNIVYRRMKADGSTEIQSWYKAPPARPEPRVPLNGVPGWVPLCRMR
jgi:hypothetical protein